MPRMLAGAANLAVLSLLLSVAFAPENGVADLQVDGTGWMGGRARSFASRLEFRGRIGYCAVMKTIMSRLAAFSLILFLSASSVAEARIGGGRSSGFRGSRSFGTRNYSTQPAQPNRGYQQPNSAQAAQPRSSALLGGASPMRGLMAGLAGGFIGSMLFQSFGHAGFGGAGRGGFGLLELMLLAGIGYFLYRRFANRRYATAGGDSSAYRGGMSHYDKLRSVEPGPFATNPRQEDRGEEASAVKLGKYDPGFDLSSFKDERMDDFMKLQAAWNHRDLSSVAPMISPELRSQLDQDIERLKQSRQINRIENIAVRGTDLIEAWQEYGQEFATVRFRANLTDYTVDEASGSVIAGDRLQPVKFEEDWTFARKIDEPGDAGSWKLTAIEN